MPSRDSITKTIRLNADDTAVLEGLMAERDLSWSGAIHYLIEQWGTPLKPKNEARVHPKNAILVPEGTPQEVVEKIKEALKNGAVQGVHPNIENGVHPTDKGVHPDFISDESREDIEKMCHLCGISTKLFFDEVDRLFNEGKLEVDAMKLKSNGEYDLKELENVCHLMNISVKDVIKKTVASLAR